MSGEDVRVTLNAKGKHTIPGDAIAPILVFVHERGATVSFRGARSRLQGDKCVAWAKMNKADEQVVVLQGSLELAYRRSGNVKRVVA
jgi:hypothetical protein